MPPPGVCVNAKRPVMPVVLPCILVLCVIVRLCPTHVTYASSYPAHGAGPGTDLQQVHSKRSSMYFPLAFRFLVVASACEFVTVTLTVAQRGVQGAIVHACEFVTRPATVCDFVSMGNAL